jgi:hypothetical protein
VDWSTAEDRALEVLLLVVIKSRRLLIVHLGNGYVNFIYLLFLKPGSTISGWHPSAGLPTHLPKQNFRILLSSATHEQEGADFKMDNAQDEFVGAVPFIESYSHLLCAYPGAMSKSSVNLPVWTWMIFTWASILASISS